MLQEVLTAMKPDEAQVWLKKCIDSGLWVPGPSDDNEDAPPPEQCKSAVVAPSLTSSIASPHHITSGAKAVDLGPGTLNPTNPYQLNYFTHLIISLLSSCLFHYSCLFC